MADEETGLAGAPTENTSLQPPRSQNIRQELKDARNTKSTLTVCDKLCLVIGGTIWATLILLILTGIPIAMIAIGSTHLNDCPRQHLIPVWLIVFGVFGALNGLSTFCGRIHAHYHQHELIPWEITPCDGLVGFFIIIWFICGTVWVYSIHNAFSIDPASGAEYCNETVYSMAYWVITLTYLFIWCFCMAWCCCRLCFSACLDPFWERV